MKINRAFSIITLLVLCLTSTPFQAQAQHPVTQSNTANGSAQSGDETQHSNLVAQARPRRRAFALMADSSYANVSGPVFSITPAAAGPNLTVVGSGSVGRLTKWIGFNSSNSFIGDSNIYEDKFGKVGIGTTAPTSLLTVAGMLEIMLGGLRFPDGSVQTTSAASALFGVAHDATLTGNGTTGSPLGVAVPLVLTGAVSGGNSVIQATNSHPGGRGVTANGGNNPSFVGGLGVLASGGDSISDIGGTGVVGLGGSSTSSFGGAGVIGSGGGSASGFGGDGVLAQGGEGSGAGKSGGTGIIAGGGLGINGATTGLAGEFRGNVQVTGTLSKGGGSFKIDHPLDPENKYLYHSFVESPDMKNIYDGNVVTDENGEAEVVMPEYFDALNSDFRYQLTVIGTFAQAIIADEIKGNRFTIKTNAPNVKVSWQVTGVRQDAFANKNRIPVEEEKPERERGYYLHPEAFNQPEEKSVNWARDPERMQQLKQQRLEAEQMRKRQPNQR